jgi:hypothetical protein
MAAFRGSLLFRHETSPDHGIPLDQLKSMLQKCVRGSGDPNPGALSDTRELALIATREVMSFEGALPHPRVPGVLTNVLHRLMITSLEDADSADNHPQLAAWVAAYRAAADAPARCQLAQQWVEVLCDAPKSRACSHYRAVAMLSDIRDPRFAHVRAAARDLAQAHHPEVWEIYQRHAAAAPVEEPGWRASLADLLRARDPRAVLRAWQIQEDGVPRTVPGPGGSRVRKSVWTVFAAIQDSGMLPPGRVEFGRVWYRELGSVKELFLCWMTLIVEIVDPHPPVEWPPPSPLTSFPTRNTAAPVVPAVALDRHVAGRARGPGTLTRFALTGALVLNPSARHPRFQAFYDDCKRLADGIAPVGARRETHYALRFRCQINTAAHKPDTYFAIAPDGREVVLKGPFPDRAGPDNAVRLAVWKRRAGLPSASSRAVSMLPDRWPEGVPLGRRNRVDRAADAWFLETENLTPLPPAARHPGSARWPPTDVAGRTPRDWDPMAAGSTPREQVDYLLLLTARMAFAVGDCADRNFLRVGGRVVMVDEDDRTPGCAPLREQLKGAKHAQVLAWYAAHGAVVDAAVAAWPAPMRVEPSYDRYMRVVAAPLCDL